MMRRLAAPLVALSILAPAGIAQPAVAKQTKKVACVKKKTGKMRMVKSKRKCPKGWKRIKWNIKGDTGSTGDQGPQGTLGTVIDGKGNTVGSYLGVADLTPTPYFSVEIDGGQYYYSIAGRLEGGSNPYYKRADCTGSAYELVGEIDPVVEALLSDPKMRLVGARSQFVDSKPRVYRLAGTYRQVSDAPYYQVDWENECRFAGRIGGYEMDLLPVKGIGDVPGPLRIK